MIVYDITDEESFKAVQNWFSEIDKFASSSVNKLLIGNKADLAGQRKVSYEQGLELANKYGIGFIETSAKSSTNVQESFKKLTEEIKVRVATGATPKGPKEAKTQAKRLISGKSLTSQDESKTG